MAIDPSGNVYAAGYVCGVAVGADLIGGGSGSCGAFVAKHSPTDQPLWFKWLNFNDGSGTGHLARADSGALYVASSTDVNGNRDIVISKFDAAGTNVWNSTVGSAQFDSVQSIAVDSAENIFVSGQTTGDFNDPSVSNGSNNYNVFVVKYHRSGSTLQKDWATNFGSTRNETGDVVIVLPNGSIAVGGRTLGAMPGSGASTPASGGNAFISVLNSSGTVSWTRQWPGIQEVMLQGLATDSAGDLYFAGQSQSDMRNTAVDRGDLDGFILKLNPLTGGTTWLRLIGSTGTDYIRGVAQDADGSIVFGGDTNGVMAGKTLTSNRHPFAGKVNASGDMQWLSEAAISGSGSGSGPFYIWSVVADPRGGVVLGGETNLNYGALNIDATNSSADAYFIRITSSGTFSAKHS